MILEAINISKSVSGPDNKSIQILENVNLSIIDNEFLTVLGPSGSGKTTLLQILGLMDSSSSGNLTILGKNTRELTSTQKAYMRANNIGFIFQSPLLINELTLEQNLILASKISKKKLDPDRLDHLLEKVGLADKKANYPKMLSTGEAQRGSLARAIINSPKIIFADEPTASLDKDNKLIVLDLLKSFHFENNISIILASHDELVLTYSNRSINLKEGKIVD